MAHPPDGRPPQAVDPAVTGLSRRDFIQASVGSAIAGGIALQAMAGQQPGLQGTGLRRPRIKDPLLILVNRITQGFSQPTFEIAKQMGYGPFLEWQLDPDAIPDPQVDQFLTQYHSLGLSHQELWEQYTQFGLDNIPEVELKAATIYRSVKSERQLYERMVEFWSNHFNIYHEKDGLKAIKTVDDREVIRKHALGKFPDLLSASAHSGAMMVYLDNYLNIEGAPQENYAREVLELHTLGVHGGYTEADVKEVARCLTGWTIEQAPNFGAFKYDDTKHDQGAKVVLGQSIPPNGGQSDGETVLQMLASHPKTAEFVSRKMCRWMLMYDPPTSLVNEVAAVFLSTGGDIKDMIRTIMAPMRLHPSKDFDWLKFSTPRRFAVALLRATQAEITDVAGILGVLKGFHNEPFDWPQPDGYPDKIASWSSSLLPRWSFASDLLNAQIVGAKVKSSKIDELIGDVPDSELAPAVDRILSGGGMAVQDEAELRAYIASFYSKEWPALRQAIAVAASCSSLQYY